MDIDFNLLIKEYEKLVNLNTITFTLTSGEILSFKFSLNQLPHLLGLQHITDIDLFHKYSIKKISASSVIKELKRGSIPKSELTNSYLLKKIYEERICHLKFDYVLQLILEGGLVNFNPLNVKVFSTKLDKVDYILWDNINVNYTHLCLGFSIENNQAYPNTFFLRGNKDYIESQKSVKRLTLHIDKFPETNSKYFKIYWDTVFSELEHTKHFKKLKIPFSLTSHSPHSVTESSIKVIADGLNDYDYILKEFNFYQMDKVNIIYTPYLTSNDLSWTNSERLHIMNYISENNFLNLTPEDVIILINKFRNTSNKKNKKDVTPKQYFQS